MAVILLVDDDKLVAESVRGHLESAGHEVAVARHGGQALEILEARAVDLVVTDILMPEVEGIEFVIAARRRGHDMPIIAMTGGGTADTAAGAGYDYLRMARDLGATSTIRKPFTRAALLAEVEACLASGGAPEQDG